MIKDNSLSMKDMEVFLSKEDLGISKPEKNGSLKVAKVGIKRNKWLHSKYKGYIGSRIYLGSDNFPEDLKVDYKLEWDKGSLCSLLAEKTAA